MNNIPKSPSLEAHQEALKLIYTFTKPEEFDSVKSILETDPRFQVLKPTQIATLLWVAENQRRLNVKSSNPPITVEDFTNPTTNPRVQEIQEEYREVDVEQFGAEEVTLPTPVQPAEEVTLPTPVPPAEEQTTKRTRRTKAEMEEQPKATNSYTLSRRVNLPIEWVQYSNNEFTVSVTSSSKEEATQELNDLLDNFLTSQWLIRKSVAENTINELRAELAKKATTPTPAVDTELQEKHQRLRDMMNFIYNNSTNKEEFIQLKNTFTSL